MPLHGLDLDRLRSHALLATASDQTVQRLACGAFLQSFPAGTTLLTEGEPVHFLYILLEGQVELQGTWSDRETTLAVLRPPATFILPAVIMEAEALMNAHTIERSRLAMLPAEAVRRAFEDDPGFAKAVAHELSANYRGLVRASKNQKLRVGAERLANYLFSEQARQGGAATFDLPHRKTVLASLLGMSPENLSRAFATLADYGVGVSGPRVTLTRNAALNRLAKPDPLIDEAAIAHSAGEPPMGNGRTAA
ncbi:cyclic nucleotide-binding domain-containing protein [Caulobacter segnis]|uniref:cyclic nucleotide-binding domain-containing protein n=1 Tax=Caulobacter segnis TaxID=88688 RepID=UPI0028649478|nr:cyclic nucleotide-binding domain-containing protein [Caulobacter segnis]MDR6623906.1 CRP/FNR family transcriptional activator FtrB [Caulobacter segnis]